MSEWVSANSWIPEKFVSVIVAYYTEDYPTILRYAVGYTANDRLWNICEPFDLPFLTVNHGKEITVKFWTLLPEVTEYLIEKKEA